MTRVIILIITYCGMITALVLTKQPGWLIALLALVPLIGAGIAAWFIAHAATDQSGNTQRSNQQQQTSTTQTGTGTTTSTNTSTQKSWYEKAPFLSLMKPAGIIVAVLSIILTVKIIQWTTDGIITEAEKTLTGKTTEEIRSEDAAEKAHKDSIQMAKYYLKQTQIIEKQETIRQRQEQIHERKMKRLENSQNSSEYSYSNSGQVSKKQKGYDFATDFSEGNFIVPNIEDFQQVDPIYKKPLTVERDYLIQ